MKNIEDVWKQEWRTNQYGEMVKNNTPKENVKPVFSCSALVETDQVKKDTTEWKIGWINKVVNYG